MVKRVLEVGTIQVSMQSLAVDGKIYKFIAQSRRGVEHFKKLLELNAAWVISQLFELTLTPL